MSYLWLLVLGATGWVGSGYPLAAPPEGTVGQVPEQWAPLSRAVIPVEYVPIYGGYLPGNRCGCPFCAAREVVQRLGAKKAAMGEFNCDCRGSYKFPVPPQATYHWPGMYAQPTMTEYPSWARFPPLKLPEEVFPPPSDSQGSRGTP